MDFVLLVIETLNEANVPYLIGGSFALWAWGEARTTRDVDLVIDIPPGQVVALSKELEKRHMLVPPDIILDLMIQPGDLPINAIHLYTGYKAELFIRRADNPFQESSFSRRRFVDVGPPLGQIYVHAPEDLILNKIRYYAMSFQSKHVRDIETIFKNIGDELDMDYILRWANQLDINDALDDVLSQAM